MQRLRGKKTVQARQSTSPSKLKLVQLRRPASRNGMRMRCFPVRGSQVSAFVKAMNRP